MTLAGTFAYGGEEDSVTVAPPLRAADVNFKVQLELAGGAITTGSQENPYRPGSNAMVPPDADVAIEFAFASAATTLLIWRGDDTPEAELAAVSATVAIIPFDIGVAFMPQRIHVIRPAVSLQEMFLLLARAAGPAANVTDEKSVVGYASVHSSAAGDAAAAAKFRFKSIVDPGLPDPEDNPTATCADPGHKAIAPIMRIQIGYRAGKNISSVECSETLRSVRHF